MKNVRQLSANGIGALADSDSSRHIAPQLHLVCSPTRMKRRLPWSFLWIGAKQ